MTAAFAPRDLVMNARTGDLLRVTPGQLIPVDGDPRDVIFGPGRLIPVTGLQPYACAVLDAIGRDVGSLTWEWPA